MRALLGNTQLLWPLVGWLLQAFSGLGKTRIEKRNWSQVAFMVTMITEVEAIINTRPLTYVYGDFYQVLH